MKKRYFLVLLILIFGVSNVFSYPGNIILKGKELFVESVGWFGRKIEKKLNEPMSSAEIRDKQRKIQRYLRDKKNCEVCVGQGFFYCPMCTGTGIAGFNTYGQLIFCKYCVGRGAFLCPECKGTGKK